MNRYYSMLGVLPTDNINEIAQAYKKRLKIVHPDRFDVQLQPDEWAQANRMLQELNEAFDWIKKNHNRQRSNAEEDISGSERTTTPPSGGPTNHTSSNTNNDGNYHDRHQKGATRTTISSLTDTHIHFLRSLTSDPLCIKIRPHHIYTNSVILGISAVLMYCIFYDTAIQVSMTNNNYLVRFFMLAVVTFFASKSGLFVYKYFKASVKPIVIFSPMYFIHIRFDEIAFGYEWEVDSIKFHREQMSLPYVNLRLGSYYCTFSAPLFGFRWFKHRIQKLHDYRSDIQDISGWLIRNDILRGIDSKTAREKERRLRALLPHIAFVLTSLLAFFALGTTLTLTRYSDQAKSKIENYASREAQNIAPSTQVVPKQAGTPEFNHPPLLLPESGKEFKYSHKASVAPLKITVPSGSLHYYVKVVTLENSPVKAVFVRSGDDVTIKVPLGTYRLKYAWGEEWYGQKYLFGPETQTAETAKDFDFRQDDGGYTGYSVELIKRTDGNLESHDIPLDQF